MGRCKYELLAPLESTLDEIRKLKGLIERKPGIFYYKSQGFMHFHEKDGKIWADIYDGESWGKPVILPEKISKTFSQSFIRTVESRLLKLQK